MQKFEFYGELRDHMGLIYRQHCGMSKKAFKRSGQNATEEATKLFFEHPNSSETLDTLIIAEEFQYEELGRPVYIPENKALLEMLWRSKMDVTMDDISEFPRCFTISWPAKTNISGIRLIGCMVWFGPQEEREGLVHYLNPYVHTGIKWKVTGKKVSDQERVLHLSFGRGSGLNRWYTRVSMPQSWMNECLQSAESMNEIIGSYDLPTSIKLSKDEQREQFVILKLCLRLMVYATAFPEALIRKWPDDIASPNERNGKSPNMLKSPEQANFVNGSHASPIPHFRNMHFRQYPIRKDGTRKPGIVTVTGHLVNATMNPTTVVLI